MKTKRTSLSKYLIFSKAGLMECFAYKFHIWAWAVVSVLAVLLQIFIWKAVFNNAESDIINGFTFDKMLCYVIAMSIAGNSMHTSDSFYRFGMGIRSGDVVMSLIKPISFRRQLAFGCVGNFSGFFLTSMMPQLVIYFIVLGAMGIPFPAFYNIILFIVSLFITAIIMDSVAFAMSSLAVFTGAIFGLFQLFGTVIGFLSGALIPLVFFPAWAQSVLQFLPFPYMLSTPVGILLGQDILSALAAVGIQLAWCIVLYAFSAVCYLLVSKRFISNGG